MQYETSFRGEREDLCSPNDARVVIAKYGSNRPNLDKTEMVESFYAPVLENYRQGDKKLEDLRSDLTPKQLKEEYKRLLDAIKKEVEDFGKRWDQDIIKERSDAFELIMCEMARKYFLSDKQDWATMTDVRTDCKRHVDLILSFPIKEEPGSFLALAIDISSDQRHNMHKKIKTRKDQMVNNDFDHDPDLTKLAQPKTNKPATVPLIQVNPENPKEKRIIFGALPVVFGMDVQKVSCLIKHFARLIETQDELDKLQCGKETGTNNRCQYLANLEFILEKILEQHPCKKIFWQEIKSQLEYFKNTNGNYISNKSTIDHIEKILAIVNTNLSSINKLTVGTKELSLLAKTGGSYNDDIQYIKKHLDLYDNIGKGDFDDGVRKIIFSEYVTLNEVLPIQNVVSPVEKQIRDSNGRVVGKLRKSDK